MDVNVLHSFSLCPNFVPLGFIDKVFNEAILTNFLKLHNGHSKGSAKCVNNNHFTKEMLATFVK